MTTILAIVIILVVAGLGPIMLIEFARWLVNLFKGDF